MYAHASGFNWDEALMVLAPIFLVYAFLRWAHRRERHQLGPNSSTTGAQ